MPQFLLKCKIHSACLKAWLKLGEQILKGSVWRKGEGGIPGATAHSPSTAHHARGLDTLCPLSPSRAMCSPQTGFPLTQATEALQKKLCGVNNQAPTPAEKLQKKVKQELKIFSLFRLGLSHSWCMIQACSNLISVPPPLQCSTALLIFFSFPIYYKFPLFLVFVSNP